MAEVPKEIALRIPEDQMQRLEKMFNNKKTLVQHAKSFIVGRMFMFLLFAGYIAFQNGGLPTYDNVAREVMGFDKSAGILTVESSGELINYMWKNDQLFRDGEAANDDWLNKVKKHIIIGSEDFPKDKKFLGIF